MRGMIAALFLAIGCVSILQVSDVQALGLKVAPLEYTTTLKAGENKQGFVDVSNPSVQTVNVTVGVQAFKQIDDNGGLQFYDDSQVKAGIVPELAELELAPRGASRIYFTIDGNKLPEGDVFAAIFFTTEPKEARVGVGQLVRVGTILSITNKTPGSRAAEITDVSLPFLQLSGTVKGTYTVKNVGKGSSGFYPDVTISSWPAAKEQKTRSSLVFVGRARSNDFTYTTGFGIHKVSVAYGSSGRSQWVITIAPWVIVLCLLVLLIIGIELLLLKRRRKTYAKSKSESTPSTS